MEEVSVRTKSRTGLIDITDEVRNVISKSRVRRGVCVVFVPHTTAGITINENADPSVQRDILKELNKVIPFNDNYLHSEGNSAAHIKASILGSSINVFVEDGSIALGTWQGIYFAEFDGPRNRKVWIKIIPGQ